MENFVLSCREDTDISIYSLYSRPYNSLNMAEELRIKNGDKQEMYETLLPQIASLVGNETDLIANMANVAAALKQTFGFFWVGFYRVIDNQLVLAPFQGPIACTRIKYGKGVCGTA